MTPKRRGRRPLDPADPSVNVHFRLPAKEYDATVARAFEARVDLSDWIRRALRLAAKKPPA